MYEGVLVEYQEQLGPTHTETLRAQMNLAALLADEGETGRARELFEVSFAALPRLRSPRVFLSVRLRLPPDGLTYVSASVDPLPHSL